MTTTDPLTRLRSLLDEVQTHYGGLNKRGTSLVETHKLLTLARVLREVLELYDSQSLVPGAPGRAVETLIELAIARGLDTEGGAAG